jgi:cystathionine beta-lyase/cystathionine gamma-synthase
LYHKRRIGNLKGVPVTEIDERPTDSRAHWRLATRAAHAAMARDPGGARPLVQPLYQSTVYTFDSVEHVDEVYQKNTPGHIYYRMGTPNTAALERSIADLEGGEDAVAAASGMGVIAAALFALVRGGDHIVADRHAYGGTHTLLTQDLPRLGIEATLVDVADHASLVQSIRPTTRAILVETLSNPTLRVSDIPRISLVGRSHRIPVVVDNTFTSPMLIRPLELGASLAWHSLAKYLGGHSAGMGGIAVGNAELIAATRAKVAHFGASLGPFDAWMVGQGLPTLPLRMAAHSSNALAIATFLSGQAAVTRVIYPGLPTHPDHALAVRLFGGQFGGMVSFSLRGGRRAAAAFLRALGLIAFAPSLADVTTTISYPIATSHRGLPDETLNGLDIDPGLLRLSVGIEDPEDVLSDLRSALAAAESAVA